MKTSCYASRRIIRANSSEVRVKSSEVHSIPVEIVKHEVYVISEDKKYITLVICKNKLIKLSSVSKSTLVVNKCNTVQLY